ncbi:hypothetical protein KM043_018628 [Ampulex compressa]|nr:hypothetical protein KM043_018628 [Ampulex compressa]
MMVYRAKKPFAITQCGHIFCKRCIQEANHRFAFKDKKYEILKTEYYNIVRNTKELSHKYNNVKAENEELEKKLKYLNNRGFNSAVITPTNAFNSMKLGSQTSVFVPSTKSIKDGIHRTSEGFRIPNVRRLLRSNDSHTTSDASSAYIYKR